MAENSIVFTDNLQEVLKAVDSALAAGLVEIGATAQGYAKDNAPVRTGTLRDSIGVEVKPDEKSVYIGTMVAKFPKDPYGKYVELGTSKMEAQPFLRPAATEHSSEYKKLMEDAMKNA